METKVEEIKTLEAEKEVEELKTEPIFPPVEKGRYIEGIGRRKRATARVRVWKSDENKDFNIFINDNDYKNYFKNIEFQKIVEAPLKKIKAQKNYKITCKVTGGGLKAQAEAVRLGLSRALVSLSPEWKSKFKKIGFLTRDPREVERKKYGKRKARKREQWQKR